MSAALFPGLFPGLLNHLWQSTIFAGVAALVTLLMRKNSAAVRYRIWFAASLKFLIPFSLFVSLGSQLPWRSPASRPAPQIAPISSAAVAPSSAASEPIISPSFFTKNIASPLAAMAPVASPAESIPVNSAWPRRILLAAVAVWLCGIVFCVTSWLRQWLRVRARLRTAQPLELDVPARIPAMSSPALIEPSVFGIIHPVLLLPESISDNLPESQIEAILLHESAHVERRDNLGAALHMAVETVFWFNPMVWWIGKRLVEERERACDEQVLRAFEPPETYAEAILTSANSMQRLP